MDPGSESGEEQRFITCRICRVKARWEECFVERNTFAHRRHHRCVACDAYLSKHRDFWFRTASSFTLLFFLSYVSMRSVRAALILTLIAYPASLFATIVHEFGHYFAAKSRGLRTAVLSIGGGPWQWHTDHRGTVIFLGASIGEGLIAFSGYKQETTRLDHAIAIAGGPLANLLFATLLVGLAKFVDLSPVTTFLTLFLAFVNGFVGIINLIPFQTNGSFGLLQSDGLQLWCLRKRDDEATANLVEDSNLNHAMVRHYVGDHKGAIDILEKSSFSERLKTVALTNKSACLAELNRIEEGVSLCRQALTTFDEQTVERLLIMNNLAYMLLLSGEENALHEACTLSEEVFLELPMLPAFKSTLGSILARSGKPEKALEILNDRNFRVEPATHRASVNAARAQAFWTLGRNAEAQAAYAEAKRLDPTNRLLGLVENNRTSA